MRFRGNILDRIGGGKMNLYYVAMDEINKYCPHVWEGDDCLHYPRKSVGDWVKKLATIHRINALYMIQLKSYQSRIKLRSKSNDT